VEIFQTLAEISIGILGFTAIVIMFRPHHSKWNNNMYQGMIGHSMQALVYSLLPFILEAYHCKPNTIWTVGSIVLGSATFTQGVMVSIFDKDAKQSTKILMVVISFIIATLQFLNVFGILSDQEKAPYLVGITWHIIQSLVIFSMIVGKKIDDNAVSK
jgi:hypothetical protein